MVRQTVKRWRVNLSQKQKTALLAERRFSVGSR
jgi:hypothetical protein